MKKNTNRTSLSIATYLIISIIMIFILMTVITQIAMNTYQEKMTEDLTKNLQVGIEGIEDEDEDEQAPSMILIDGLQIKNSTKFRVFSIFISIISIGIGSFLIYFIILHLLKPLKSLSKNIKNTDINKISSNSNKIFLKNYAENQYREVSYLSKSFNEAMEKILRNYEEQKNFSSNVAHELRTPLALIQTKIDVFKMENNLDSKSNEFISEIEASLERLSDLVGQILFLNNRNALNISKFQINDIIEEIFLDLEEKANKKNVSLQYDSEINEGVLINTDETLFQLLLFNLVENAIKYNTQNGYVKVEIHKDQLKKISQIKIIDSGVGINEEDKNRIFDIFYRAENSRNRESGGYGIGLSLCLSIVNKLRWKIDISDNNFADGNYFADVKSDNHISDNHFTGKEKGSVFTITLP